MIGTIKKLTDKGYGFIVSQELGKDLFFHSKSLVGVSYEELREGQKVSFETEQSPKGLNAINVKLAQGNDRSTSQEGPENIETTA